ncbi:MAG: hypothetical protein IKH30_01415 [Clostridia bacterium]|nr:hypothetical protein [Clostridia bacterium]
MMKKFLAVLLCVSMLLGCAALAETEKASLGVVNVNGAFELKCALPEGYSLEVLFSETHFCIASVNPEDEAKPTLMISVAYNELYSDVERINDLDEESVKSIEDSFRVEDDVEITYMETAYGTRLMVVKEVSDGVDYLDFYTIYKGYEVELVLIHANAGEPITEAEIQIAVKFLSDMDFVGV